MTVEKKDNVIQFKRSQYPKTGERWDFKDQTDPLNIEFSIIGVEGRRNTDPIVWFKSQREIVYKQPMSVFLNLYKQKKE